MLRYVGDVWQKGKSVKWKEEDEMREGGGSVVREKEEDTHTLTSPLGWYHDMEGSGIPVARHWGAGFRV